MFDACELYRGIARIAKMRGIDIVSVHLYLQSLRMAERCRLHHEVLIDRLHIAKGAPHVGSAKVVTVIAYFHGRCRVGSASS